MLHTAPDLLDEDLVRLRRLGGDIGQIAEAAGTDAAQVLQRLAHLDLVTDAPRAASPGLELAPTR